MKPNEKPTQGTGKNDGSLLTLEIKGREVRLHFRKPGRPAVQAAVVLLVLACLLMAALADQELQSRLLEIAATVAELLLAIMQKDRD